MSRSFVLLLLCLFCISVKSPLPCLQIPRGLTLNMFEVIAQVIVLWNSLLLPTWWQLLGCIFFCFLPFQRLFLSFFFPPAYGTLKNLCRTLQNFWNSCKLFITGFPWMFWNTLMFIFLYLMYLMWEFSPQLVKLMVCFTGWRTYTLFWFPVCLFVCFNSASWAVC